MNKKTNHFKRTAFWYGLSILSVCLWACHSSQPKSLQDYSDLSYRFDRKSMVFLDSATVFMGASCPDGYGAERNPRATGDDENWQAVCLCSRDGGVTWTHHPIAGGRTDQLRLKRGILYACITGKENPGHPVEKLYVSRDQGITWTWKGDLPRPALNLIVIDSLWLFAGNENELFEIRDGGRTWKERTGDAADSYTTEDVMKLFFGDIVEYFKETFGDEFNFPL